MEEATAAKEAKQHLHQINRIKAITKEIKNEEKEQESKTLLRREKKAQNETRPGKYGPGKFMVFLFLKPNSHQFADLIWASLIIQN